MTTHPVPLGRQALLAAASRLNTSHARTADGRLQAVADVDDIGQPLNAATVDGDPYDRPAPLPQRTPGAALQRQARIDSIHALADFYAVHPEVPLPSLVVGNSYVDSHHDLLALAARLGAETFGDGTVMDHDITRLDTGTWTIARVAFAESPERPL